MIVMNLTCVWVQTRTKAKVDVNEIWNIHHCKILNIREIKICYFNRLTYMYWRNLILAVSQFNPLKVIFYSHRGFFYPLHCLTISGARYKNCLSYAITTSTAPDEYIIV